MRPEDATPPALAGRGLTRRYGGRAVVEGVDVVLKPRRLTAVLGPSGAGKSTLLRLLAGLEPVDAGEVVGAGARILSAPGIHVAPERRDVGVVFQDYALFPHLTAAGNVAFGLTAAPRPARLTRADELLAAAGLAERARAYPHELSGGEQQRVALLRALAPGPSTILMDEPFSNLDDALRRSMAETALELLKPTGAAALLVTHHAEEAMFMADDLVLMAEGRVIQSGPPAEVYLDPVSLAAARITGPVNAWRGAVENGALETPFGRIAAPAALEGRPAFGLARPEAVRLVQGANATVAACRPAGAHALADVVGRDGVTTWRIRTELAVAPTPGARTGVALDPALSRVVPAD